MITTKTVLLSWMPINKQYFIDRGYAFTKYKDKFQVNVEDLNPNSNSRIEYICDYCNKEQATTYFKYLKSLNNFPPIKKVCCSQCRYLKNKEILLYKSENDLLNIDDNGYFISKKNRVLFIKNFIEKNGNLKHLTKSKEGWKIINNQHKYRDNLIEIVEELGYKYFEMVSIKHDYYDDFSILEKNIREWIDETGRFPSYDELVKDLKCIDQFISMHGGMIGIINKMNYNVDKELIDDSGYFNQSSYEYIVSQFLLNNHIPFKRNQNPFPDTEKNYMSDFALYPKFGKEIHIEVWGLGTDEYKATRKEKQKLYDKYQDSVHLISLEKKLFRKKYDEIQDTLIDILGDLLTMDLTKVDNDHIIPKVLSDEEILEKLLQLSSDEKTLPKYEELRKLKKEKLFDEAVRRHGSYMAFANKYNLQTHGKNKGFWNEMEAFNQLVKVAEIHGSVSYFMSTDGKCDTTNEFKGLYHYIQKMGNRKLRLNFFLYCLENSIDIKEKDREFIIRTSNIKDKKYEEFSLLAEQIKLRL